MDGQSNIDVASGPDMCVVTWPASQTPAIMEPTSYMLLELLAEQHKAEGIVRILMELAKDIRMIQGVE